MALTNLFKLEKLKIHVYGDRPRTGWPADTFEVMFNPTSFSMRHENVFYKYQGLNTSGKRAMYAHSHSDRLSLSLVFDGTGVTDYGLTTLLGLDSKTVSEQVEAFLTACFHMDGELHEPKFLKIQWGDGALRDFDCRLQSVEITYTSFDQRGAPLRAELRTVFVEDLDAAKRVRKENKSSPDLPHTRTVKHGDTLPLLTQSIYGSSAYYLRVAQVNGLDDFRNLTPGQELLFPPLEK
jgi:LysM repeat protein